MSNPPMSPNNALSPVRAFLHLLLVWLFTLPAILPLAQPALTRSADGLLHLYRLLALQQALQSGVLFPRWLPDLAFGYGFPLFVFYAPFSYYITVLPTLAGLPLAAALNASFGVALLLSAAGAYLLVKELFGPKAGVLAAVAYVYAPFQLVNTLFRGSLPAAWAMAMFPVVFWLFTRLLRQSPAATNIISPTLIAATLAFGAALLTHNTLTLLFAPLLTFYLAVWLGVLYWRGQIQRHVLIKLALALLLGAGLAAFFLLPAMVEKEFAQVWRVITPPDFDFHTNFVSLRELFSLPAAANTGLLNPTVPLSLGLAQVLLAAAGFLGGGIHLYRKATSLRENKVWIGLLFAGPSLLVAIFMMLSVSAGVWESLPLIAFVQFPHRLLGPTALVLALLAGLLIYVAPGRAAFWLTAFGATTLVVSAVPLLYPRYQSAPVAPTTPQMMAYEHDTGTIGTTSFGEYLPVWVAQIPRESPLEGQYATGGPVTRLAREYLPTGARVISENYGFNQAEIQLDTPAPAQAVFHTFFFPGWQAQVDGQPTEVTPVSERGLAAISVPAGTHRLQLKFADTAVRRAANLISLVALAILAGGVFYLLATRKRHPESNPAASGLAGNEPFNSFATRNIKRPQAGEDAGFGRAALSGLAALALLLTGGKLLYLDRFDSPLKQTFNGQTVTAAETRLDVNFGNRFNLLGYSLERDTTAPGRHFDLTLYWQARQPAGQDFSALAQLVDDDGHLFAGQDNLHPGTFPTHLWQPWEFAQDAHHVPVPPGTPPGDYWLATGLYNPKSGARLPVVSGGDARRSDTITVPVRVEKLAEPAAVADLGITWPATLDFAELRLLGALPEREDIPRGDFLRVALFWEALETPAQDYRVNLQLLDSAGQVAAESSGPPSFGRYPTTRWAAGERVRDNHALWIPADFPAGEYRVQARVLNESGAPLGAAVILGTLVAK